MVHIDCFWKKTNWFSWTNLIEHSLIYIWWSHFNIWKRITIHQCQVSRSDSVQSTLHEVSNTCQNVVGRPLIIILPHWLLVTNPVLRGFVAAQFWSWDHHISMHPNAIGSCMECWDCWEVWCGNTDYFQFLVLPRMILGHSDCHHIWSQSIPDPIRLQIFFSFYMIWSLTVKKECCLNRYRFFCCPDEALLYPL